MFGQSIRAGVVLLVLGLWAGADEKKAAKEPAKPSGFDRLKKLAGTWVQADDKGKATDKVVSVFRVVGAGSAVEETIFPGAAYEMITMYHMDGADLVLTHYCSAGNQPRMKADPKAPGGKLEFTFTGGSNLDTAKDHHIHEGSITFVDDNHIDWKWVSYDGGKPNGSHTIALKLIRKK